MIFYFSGTGNSLHVAKSLQNDEKIVDMAEALKKRRCGFHIKEGEAVGFVCPVYASGLPKVVLDFIRHLRLKDHYSYIYLVLTHAGGPGAAGAVAMRELKKRGYALNAIFDVKMPTNYIFILTLPDQKVEDERILAAEPVIQEIREAVLKRSQHLPSYNPASILASYAMYPVFDGYRSTDGFYADDRCVGCGACESRCPVRAISMVDGRPVWRKKHCIRCMSCLRCNAIQYNDKLKDKRRYRYHKVEGM